MKLLISGYDHNDGHTSESPCHSYAVIREEAAGVTLNICATTERRSHLYTTLRNSVEISIITENLGGEPHPFFMLEFQGNV